MTRSFLERVSFSDVESLLDRWWGQASPSSRGAARLTPDAITTAARNAGWHVDIAAIESWEHRTDQDMLAEVLRRAGPFAGELLIITEASFVPPVGAFRFDARLLLHFLQEHGDRFEPVFNGDLILIVLQEEKIVCVHHENHLITMSPRAGRK